MQVLSSLCKDFIASHIRHQVVVLESILENIENSGRLDDNYVEESLKKAETTFRQLRKSLA